MRFNAIANSLSEIEAKPSDRLHSIASRIAFMSSCLVLLFLTGCAWPMYRQGQTRSGRSGIDTSANTGTLLWNYNVGYGQNRLPLGPMVGLTGSSGGIFLGDLYGQIYSISTDGSLAWSVPLSGGIGAAPNAVGIDGSVYAPQPGGTLFAVSSSGTPTWTFAPSGGLSPADLAVATDGTIYTGNQCGVFYALNPDGSIKWSYSGFQRDCNQFYTPTIFPAAGGDGTIYGGVNYGNSTGVLFALSSSGSLIWRTSAFVGTPSIASSGMIYVISLDGQHLFALNSGGVLQWQVNAPYQNKFTLPAIASDGTVYVGTAGAGLWSIAPTGIVNWQATPGGNRYFFAPPTIGGEGTIYIAYTSLLAVNPDSSLKWSTSLCGGEGVYASLDEPEIGLNGTIYMILDGYTSGEQAPCSRQAFQ